MATKTSVLAFIVSFLFVCVRSSVFDNVLGDVTSCVDVCKNTYQEHTSETVSLKTNKGFLLDSCQRGCRLFSVIDFINEHHDLNTTKETCNDSCREAYTKIDKQDACYMGCSNQVPFVMKNQELLQDADPSVHMLYPMIYLHSMYSNMFSKMYQHFSVSWTIYSSDNNQIIVMRSEPQMVIVEAPDDFTTKHLENNILAQDNSATPDLKHSQMHSIRSMDNGGLTYSLRDPDPPSSDWLTCIATKTGIPKLVLSLVIFLCAVMMIWLCLTAAVTGPDQRVKSQKLSIYGDLDYLKELEANNLKFVHLQDRFEASPLPIKIKVERI